VVAFLVSAALCGTSAVALVLASRDDGTPSALPSPSATPSPTESPTPEPTASPTPVVTTAPTPTATAAPTPSATASPTKRPTTAPRPSPTRTTQAAGLFFDGKLDPASGTSPGQDVALLAHATDGDGTIRLVSVNWGDGTKATTFPAGAVTDCASIGKADCKDFELHHTYSAGRAEPYVVTITISSAGSIPESASLTFKEFVNAA
jgi:hypothetical protein